MLMAYSTAITTEIALIPTSSRLRPDRQASPKIPYTANTHIAVIPWLRVMRAARSPRNHRRNTPPSTKELNKSLPRILPTTSAGFPTATTEVIDVNSSGSEVTAASITPPIKADAKVVF